MHVLSVPVSLHLKLQYHYINMHDHDVTVNVDISSMHCNTLHQCHWQCHKIFTNLITCSIPNLTAQKLMKGKFQE